LITNANSLDKITWNRHNYFTIPLTSLETHNTKLTVFCETNRSSSVLGTARNDLALNASLWENINRLEPKFPHPIQL
jgi:hypothetical protein